VPTAARSNPIGESFAVIGARSGKTLGNSDQTCVNIGRTGARVRRHKSCARIELKSEQTDVRFDVITVNFAKIDETCVTTAMIFVKIAEMHDEIDNSLN
jgi:hypothetical protein